MKLIRLLSAAMLFILIISCAKYEKSVIKEEILPRKLLIGETNYWCFSDEDTKIILKEAYR